MGNVNKSTIYCLIISLIFLVTINLVLAEDAFNNPTGGNLLGSPSSNFSNVQTSSDDVCSTSAKADFDIFISSCTPSVVTSNLLAEQDVSVMCQLNAVRLNSLIQASAISSISFSGDYPEEVRSISYHPYRSSLSKTSSKVIDDVLENIGYVVIVLKKQPNEDNLEKYVAGVLTANIKYTFVTNDKIKDETLYLNLDEINTGEYISTAGLVKVRDYSSESVRLTFNMLGVENYASFNLNQGETSNVVYLPGYECKAGFRVKFEGIVPAKNKVDLNIDGINYMLREGDSILNGACIINKIVKDCDIPGSKSGVKCEDTPIGQVLIKCGSEVYTLRLKSKSVDELKDNEKNIEIFEPIKKDLTELLNNFPKEKSSDEKYYAELALYDSIFLARDLGLAKTQKELVNRYVKEFQYSEHFTEISIMNVNMQKIDRGEAARSISLKNGVKSAIIINNFYFLSDEKSVTVSFNLNIDGEDKTFSDRKEGDYIDEYGVIISKINEDSAVFYVKEESVKLEVGESKYFENENKKIVGLRLDKVNYNNVAKIRIIPKIDSGDIAMNFTFHIPMEKRTFALSPEKAKERADGMNDTIRIVGGIVDLIEGIHNGWSAVCGVARTYTTIKMITALANGEALCRMSVMQTFKEKCKDAPEGIDKCLLKHSDDIDKAVKEYSKDVKDLQSKFKEEYKKNKNETEVAGSLVSEASKLKGWESGDGNLFISINGENIPLTLDTMSVSQMEKYALFSSVASDGGKCGDNEYYCQTILKDVNKEFAPIIEQHQGGKQGQKVLFSFTLFPFVLGDSEDSEEVEGSKDSKKEDVFVNSCSNKIISGQVEYYERGPALGGLSNLNGLAAVVPFDTEGGWYAYVSSSRGDVFDDKVKAYSSNGEVLNFYICNVGKDNAINYGLGQDLCRSFEVKNPIYDKFTPCESYSEAQVKNLYNKAYTAIMEANRQYGSDKVNILGQTFAVGKALSALMGFECMDFLSPQDCIGVQKVCDWVECPSDRCNMKGKWMVQDVTQTGVIGSVVYCIGNGFVCIPGIYAGLDAFRSTLVEHQNCLNTRATTGEYIGSCDKIMSFYICEMVTKHAVSLVNSGLTWVANLGISSLGGGSTYLNFLTQRKELSAIASNYIANYLSTSLDKLFDINLENMSYDLCNSVINTPSVGIGDGGKQSWISGVWNALSPTTGAQFTGSISEKSYTDATTPPESIYSVFYSIYAGSKERSYSVYLAEPSSISSSSTHVITKGIIPARESKIENKDFTAISGYKKLCISVDGQTKCDFGVTSSLYGVNFVIDEILLTDVNSTKITTEADCLSFSHRLNLIVDFLEGDNMLDSRDSISNVGISRVCASKNPESSATLVKSDDRWRNVGYCGDENVICWLDTEDISKVLSTIGPERIKNIGIKETSGTYEAFTTKLEDLKKRINSFTPGQAVGDVKTYNELNKNLSEIIDTSSGATNNQKAYAYYLKIYLNSILAKNNIFIEDGVGKDCLLNCLENMGDDQKKYCQDECEKLSETVSVFGFSYNPIGKGEILYKTRSTGICLKEATGIYDYYLQSCSLPYTKFGYIGKDKSIKIMSGYESNSIKGEDITYSVLNDYLFINGEFEKQIGFNIKENKIYYNYNYIDLYLSADRNIYDLSGKNVIASLNSDNTILVDKEFRDGKIVGTEFTYVELEKYRVLNGALYKDADRLEDSCAKGGWVWIEDEKICVECLVTSDCSAGKVCDDIYNKCVEAMGFNLKDGHFYYNYDHVDMYLSNNRNIYDSSGENVIGSLNSNNIIMVNSEFKDKKITGTEFTYKELEKYTVSNGVLYEDADRLHDSCAKNGLVWLQDERRCVDMGFNLRDDGIFYYNNNFAYMYLLSDRNIYDASEHYAVASLDSNNMIVVKPEFRDRKVKIKVGGLETEKVGFTYEELENYRVVDGVLSRDDDKYNCIKSGLIWIGSERKCVEAIGFNLRDGYIYYNDDYIKIYLSTDGNIYDSSGRYVIASLNSDNTILVDKEFRDGKIVGTEYTYEELENYGVVNGVMLRDIPMFRDDCVKYGWNWIEDEKICVECLVTSDCSAGKVCDDIYNKCVEAMGFNLKDGHFYYNYDHVDMYLSNNRNIYDSSGENVIGSLNSNNIIMVNSEFKDKKITGTEFTYKELEKYTVSNGVLYEDADRLHDSCAKNGLVWLKDERRCVHVGFNLRDDGIFYYNNNFAYMYLLSDGDIYDASEHYVIASLDSNNIIVVKPEFRDKKLKMKVGGLETEKVGFTYKEIEGYRILDGVLSKEDDRYNCFQDGLIWKEDEKKCVDTGFNLKDDGIFYYNNNFAYMYLLSDGNIYDAIEHYVVASLNSNNMIVVKSEYKDRDIMGTKFVYKELENYRILNGALYKDADRLEDSCAKGGWNWIEKEKVCVECLASSDCGKDYHCDLFSRKCMYDYDFYMREKYIIYGGEKTKFFIDDKGKIKKSGILFFSKNVGKVLEDGTIAIEDKYKSDDIVTYKLFVLEGYTFRDGVLEKK